MSNLNTAIGLCVIILHAPIHQREVHTTDSDKELFVKTSKLNSSHMVAVSKIARQQFPNINRLQLTERVPLHDKEQKSWKIGNIMDSVQAPACQIHHTHSDHWIVSFKTDKVFVFDSLGNERPDNCILSPGLQIQLARIYGKDVSSIQVNIPDTQRQNNSVDCGLFAIAHLTEFCLKGHTCPNVIFDTTQMRSHLVSCLEQSKLTEFPKTNKMLNSRRRKAEKIVDLELICICNLPLCVDSVVECLLCQSKYHKQCVIPPTENDVGQNFICNNCQT